MLDKLGQGTFRYNVCPALTIQLTLELSISTLSQVVADFISSLPMAASWDGPLVNVDLLIQSISESNYEQLQRNQANKGDESDEEEDFDDRKPSQPGTTGPTTDLYRQRMMRKQKKPL